MYGRSYGVHTGTGTGTGSAAVVNNCLEVQPGHSDSHCDPPSPSGRYKQLKLSERPTTWKLIPGRTHTGRGASHYQPKRGYTLALKGAYEEEWAELEEVVMVVVVP